MRYFSVLIFIVVLFTLSCNDQPAENVKAEAALSSEDRALCELLKIDSSLIKQLREHTKARLDKFTPEPVWVNTPEGEFVERESKLNGLYFEASQEMAKRYISELSADFQENGYTIYLCEENFGIENTKDKVAIVSTADKYEILRETGTDGINYDIDNDSLIKIIKDFDAKYELTLIGCNYDWCEFSIGKPPSDYLQLAGECYAICPDIVDQGTGSVESLADEIKRTGTLYFWWD